MVRWLTGWATSRSSWPVACCVPQDSAVRAYLAADSPQRRVEAFAVFNVFYQAIFYQAGIFAGPLVGLALMAIGLLSAGALHRLDLTASVRTDLQQGVVKAQ